MKLTEKKVQSEFVAFLKDNDWETHQYVKDQSKKNIADVIAFRSDVDCYIGFELKVHKGIITYTKALKQIIQYTTKKD